ncbi:TorD/DmsD family molecular chaperone [Adlercreutzia sp. ZJ141]|uniref:TorD/DmsD family molecular chaperone n=1 Tax=Adlercreutzia sp. ZJ141 TaxID=2709406 RepID=UPI0013EC5EB5|nr:molecular chaperone TorD family protein [Adlercreutzia sp. ZJ141]
MTSFAIENVTDSASGLAILCRESIDLEALLLSRAYLYTLFHKLLGGTPDAAMLTVLLSADTADAVEEFTGDNISMQGLGRFLCDLRECVDAQVLLDAARDEYTRLFIGPEALPCQPIESPYLTHELADFQENTIVVRRIYRDHGFELARLMRIPDDHIATMCDFMARLSESSLDSLREGSLEKLAESLRDQETFVRGHMLTWVNDFAVCARRSKTSVLYPQMIEALAAFATNDATLLSEAALWAENTAATHGFEVAIPLGVSADSPEAAAFAELQATWDCLRKVHPYGIEDHELVIV